MLAILFSELGDHAEFLGIYLDPRHDAGGHPKDWSYYAGHFISGIMTAVACTYIPRAAIAAQLFVSLSIVRLMHHIVSNDVTKAAPWVVLFAVMMGIYSLAAWRRIYRLNRNKITS